MSVENIVITAKKREVVGKGAAGKLRKQGIVPGVLHHKGKAVNIEIAVSSLPKKRIHAQPLKLNLNGSEKTVIMQEVQVDPLNDQPIHFDFQEVKPSDKVRTCVPLNFIGLSKEQEKEGAFHIQTRYLDVRAALSKLPASIDVDVSQLKVDKSISVQDLNLSKDITVKTGRGKNVALASLIKI